jgi:hypothetical protein
MLSGNRWARIAEHDAAIRRLAIAAALVAAALYALIGLGVLDVGRPSSGAAPDLGPFGAVMATTFMVVAIALARFTSVPALVGVILVQLIVIVGYFAMAGVRVPGIEINGLLVKLAQLVVLISAIGLLLETRARHRPTAQAHIRRSGH